MGRNEHRSTLSCTAGVAGFSFYNHRTLFEDQWLLSRNGIHLSKWDKNIYGNRLAKPVKRALN